ncbi:MAG: threonine synthase [Parasphingopyxis sp.]|uniref:threonine synthase n=1 Tax=Parasphingopyxis sp. TaxID=1920299 RepID=UPI003FA04B0C
MTASHITHLECTRTGETVEAGRLHNLSPAGAPLFARYDLDALRNSLTKASFAGRPDNFWRYRELLPVRDAANIASLGETFTPLIPLNRLSDGQILVKDEGRLPTGSFKARGLAMAIAMAKELGVRRVAIPTNGNAGAAASAYASRAGLESFIFCPEDTPDVNVRETALQGGKVWRCNGLIDDCGKFVHAGEEEMGWFNVATLREPYRVEGKKTMGIELAEQLGWEVPDVIFYPTGGGTGLIGMWKAFAELEAVGLIGSKRPRMVAVQAEGCAPIVRAWNAGADTAERWENAATGAAGIRVPAALGDFLILRALRESDGFAIAVDEQSIFGARARVAREEGLLLCPEGAATVAGYLKALETGQVRPGDRAVLFNCGNGLKYPMPDGVPALDITLPFDWTTIG